MGMWNITGSKLVNELAAPFLLGVCQDGQKVDVVAGVLMRLRLLFLLGVYHVDQGL